MGKACQRLKGELRDEKSLSSDDALECWIQPCLNLSWPFWQPSANMFLLFFSSSQFELNFCHCNPPELYVSSQISHLGANRNVKGSPNWPRPGEKYTSLQQPPGIPPASEALPPKLRACRRTGNICKASSPRPAETLH